MQHDKKYLESERERLTSDTDMSGYAIESCLIVAEKYYEHMMKWRSMDKPPEKGSWVEVLCSNLGEIHTITYGPARFNDTDLGWRPAPPLPCDVKENQ